MEQVESRPPLAKGLYFEGPRWHDARLWMVDSLARTLLSVGLNGDCRIECEIGGISGGMGFLPNGDAVVTSMFDRKLLTFAGGKVTTLVDLSSVAAGTIDDMIADGQGRIFVGDLGIDMMRNMNASHENGQLILIAPGCEARVVAHGLHFPNGIAVSDDGRRLVVAESDGNRLAHFNIGADGSLDLIGRFGNFIEPDGICLDREGAAWVSLFQGDAFVRVNSDGRVMQRIPAIGGRAIACVLGGEARRTLFCISAETTHEDLMRGKSAARVDCVQVEVAGAGQP